MEATASMITMAGIYRTRRFTDQLNNYQFPSIVVNQQSKLPRELNMSETNMLLLYPMI